MGGYCYLNNAAIAAQYLLDHGSAHVAVLDVDYHHGNGTQSIFYDRAATCCSCRCTPTRGTSTRTSSAIATRRAPAPAPATPSTTRCRSARRWQTYGAALADACGKIAAFSPDALVVSLGVDTYEHDPISGFQLTVDDFPKIGARIAALGLPTLFVMEGGYAVDDIGVNAVNVLTGFEETR